MSPRYRRLLQRLIPFALIWLLMGWVFLLVESAAMGTPSPDSPVIINLTLPVILFASLAVFIVGFLVGLVELVYLEKRFRDHSFIQKILFKFIIYSVLLLLIILITYPAAASVESGISFFDKLIWRRSWNFLFSITFLSTMLQMSVSLFLSLIYGAISENVGFSVFANFFTGKYHTPVEEQRIFMFLDMKASTTIAEKLGHVKYFSLLRDYYNDLAGSIIDHEGEVYQYIGDEVVITWTIEKGLRNNNCISCFFAMKEFLRKRESHYLSAFGVIPYFKAGMHLGSVTTGEIGALKKEIFFTGDVLNTTSRIQGLCNDYQADLIVSGVLLQRIEDPSKLKFESLGKQELRGKTSLPEIFRLEASLSPVH